MSITLVNVDIRSQSWPKHILCVKLPCLIFMISPYTKFHIVAAFALSSGTIGAAMSASLSRKRAIALSYGTFLYPTPVSLYDPAHRLACNIITRLWNNWGADPQGLRGDGEVDLYNVNIPVIKKLLSDGGLGVTWSTMWRNSYGRLFSPHNQRPAVPPDDIKQDIPVPAGGPDAYNLHIPPDSTRRTPSTNSPPASSSTPLVFKFSPDMQDLVKPQVDALPAGTDTWAVHNDLATVTPLRASFAEPPADISMAFPGEASTVEAGVRYWKMKL